MTRLAIRALTLWWVSLALCVAALASPLVIDVLDVGQGDAILVRAGGRSVLVDAGPSKTITEQLERLGVRGLDLAVASHAHADHIGGMEAVIRSMSVRYYLDNSYPHTSATYRNLMKAIEDQRVRYMASESGQEIALTDDVKITILAPPPEPFSNTRSDHNSNSVILWIQHGDIDVLLTGDAEAPTETWLVEQGVPQVEILKVAHHGSDHSSLASFLEAVKPQVALISCGRDNKYGHPGPGTLARLAQVGAKVYRTDTMGQIRVISDGKRFEVRTGSLDAFGAGLPSTLTPPPPSPPHAPDSQESTDAPPRPTPDP